PYGDALAYISLGIRLDVQSAGGIVVPSYAPALGAVAFGNGIFVGDQHANPCNQTNRCQTNETPSAAGRKQPSSAHSAPSARVKRRRSHYWFWHAALPFLHSSGGDRVASR